MYIDTHAHILDEVYGTPEAVIARLREEGIDRIVNVGYDLPSSVGTAALCERHSCVYGLVGIHPEHADTVSSEALCRLASLATKKGVLGIGEIGLDYHYTPFDKEQQKQAFLQQLELAYSLKKPFCIHLRDAAGDMNELLTKNRELLRYGGVMHCYAQSAELVPFYLKLGLYISFTGAVTFKNARGLLDAVRAVPADRLLTETDCPYLTPEPYRGKTNFPFYVKYVAKRLAELKEMPEEAFCAQVKENARALFHVEF